MEIHIYTKNVNMWVNMYLSCHLKFFKGNLLFKQNWLQCIVEFILYVKINNNSTKTKEEEISTLL